MFYVLRRKKQIDHRIKTYIKTRLRAPPERQVFEWSDKLKIPRVEAKQISDSIALRHRLGEPS